jgi:polyisoprenoid-binding protein YceI
VILLIYHALIFASEWQVDKDSENLVKFTSSTWKLSFDGVTARIDGYMYNEDDNFASPNNELYFEVDLNSIDTGIGKRNRDMREDYLETDKWPFTHFKGSFQKVEKIDTTVTAFDAIVKGNMFIHGVEKEIEVPGILISEENNRMHIMAKFMVLLTDYNIEIPQLMILKLDNEIYLTLDFYLKKTQ